MVLAFEKVRAGARLCDDDALGLHAAELLRPGMFDVLDYAVRSAPTLRASLERLVRYNRLVHDAAEFTLIERGDVVRIEHAFRFGAAAQCRHSAEFTLAAIVVLANQLTGTAVRPRAIDFRHGKPASGTALVEHARIFGVAPRFAQRVNTTEPKTFPSAATRATGGGWGTNWTRVVKGGWGATSRRLASR